MRTPLTCAACVAVVLCLSCGGPAAPPGKASSPAPAAQCPLEPGYTPLTVSVGGQPRTALARLGNQAGPRPPLVLAWHGFGSSADNTMGSLRPERTFDEALIVAPTGLGRTFEKFGDTERPGWQTHVGELGDRDLALFDALLAELAPCFDPDRVYSTGFSNGGHFSHLLGCVRAEKVTAIAPVGGALKERATCDQPVPTLIVHGTADEVVPYSLAEASTARWQTTNGCTPSPGSPAGDHCTRLSCETDLRICAFEGGHTWPRWASAEVGAFFANQPTSPASP